MVSEVVRTISQDDHEWARLASIEKAELDAQSRRVTAERRARAELEEAERREREAEQQRIACNALDEGLSFDVVQKITGLPLDKIEALKSQK